MIIFGLFVESQQNKNMGGHIFKWFEVQIRSCFLKLISILLLRPL